MANDRVKASETRCSTAAAASERSRKPLEQASEGNKVTTGISTYPVGSGAPLHTHNCDEHVILLSGLAEVRSTGILRRSSQTTHLRRIGRSPRVSQHRRRPMVILWVYPAAVVTRRSGHR